MKTTVYRYNAKDRMHHSYNNCGKEKNPNAIRFYARTMDYADKYKNMYTEDGEFWYECELETAVVDMSTLFDMESNFKSLNTYKKYLDETMGVQIRDYTELLEKAKTKKDKKLWQKHLDGVTEEERIDRLKMCQFQDLSDFELQNDLVAELKALGFSGYFTEKEVAVI